MLVGAQEARFQIHEEYICRASKYFEAVFTGHFKEAAERVIKLPDKSPETFDDFLEFCYHGRVQMMMVKDADDAERLWWQAGRLYVLADYFEAAQLKSHIIEHLFKVISLSRIGHSTPFFTPSADFVDFIYSNTVRGAGLRKLIVQHHIAGSDTEPWHTADDTDIKFAAYHEEFLGELVTATLRQVGLRSTRNPFNSPPYLFYDGTSK